MKCKVKKLDSRSKFRDAEEKEEEVVETDFTKEEVKSLKKLLPHMDELLMMLEVSDKEEDLNGEEIGADEDEDIEKIELEEEEEFVEDDCDVEDEEEEEEKVFKKEEVVRDSKRSFGSIERKRTQDSEPEIDAQEEIAESFRKYYGGK